MYFWGLFILAMKHLLKGLLFLIALVFLLFSANAQTPVGINGALQVKGIQLSNQYGYPVQLKGMSSHGLQWYGDMINANSIQTMKADWGADVVRLAMYVGEGGYLNDPTYWKANIKQKADMVIAAGLYVIIDWHVLTPGDPNAHIAEAKDFFEYFSKLYKDVPNVIFEICNEPNQIGEDSWRLKIKPYAEQIIPIIRANYAKAIVLVGTPVWSSKPGDVHYNRLSAANEANTLYSFHYYAGSHFTEEYINQFSDKVPMFMDEWGVSTYSGNGGNNYVNGQTWFDLMNGNNQGKQLMSWCNWSFSNKAESSAALSSSTNFNATTPAGTFVKNEMKKPDNFITALSSAPIIYVQPFSQKIFNKTNAYLRVAALGTNLKYQWYKDNALISGATNADYVVTDFGSAKAGKYKVVVSNATLSTTSTEAVLSLETSQPNGTIQTLPGKLEIEKYDIGASDITYHTTNNTLAESTGETTSKALTGMVDNDWLKYTVTFTESGFYSFNLRAFITGGTNPSKFWVALDQETKTKIINIPIVTNAWTNASTDTVYVAKGTYVMKLLFDVTFGDCKFDYLQATKLTIDCNKTNNGTAFVDSCGICVGGTTGKIASLDTDKDGVYDCKDLCPKDPLKSEPGVCGCGVAEGACMDCFGIYGGTALIDNCGVCSGGTTGRAKDETCKDCNGVMNGTASIDQCMVCSGGNTGIVPNATCRDCYGVLNGTAKTDNCGVCNGANTTCVPCTGVVDDCGVCNGNKSTCNGTLKPFKGVRKVIPGKIEAEEYDAGGATIAYSDTDTGNNGSQFRTDDVDIEVSDNKSFALGWVQQNEWTKYSVTVNYTGLYNIVVRGASNEAGKSVDIRLGNTLISDNQSIPNTGSFSTYSTSTVTGVSLIKGDYVLQITNNSYGQNLDYLEFVPQFTVDCKGTLNGTAVLDVCGICSGDGTSCKDCNGVKNGTAYLDACAICVGGNTSKTACKIDCNANWGGSAKKDSCGVCAGGNTGKLFNSSKSGCITGLDDSSIENLVIYPNPAKNRIYIEGVAIESLGLTSALGVGVQFQSGNTNFMDVSSLAKGVYFLNVKTREGKSVMRQIVIE